MALRDAATNQTQQMFRVGGTGARAAAAAGPLPTVLLICNQHARELITAELCFWLLRALARDTKTLNEWPEVAAALNATAAAARAAGRAGPIPRTLDQWASRINSRLRVEVCGWTEGGDADESTHTSTAWHGQPSRMQCMSAVC